MEAIKQNLAKHQQPQYSKNVRWEVDTYVRINEKGAQEQRIMLVDCGARCGVSVAINNGNKEAALERLFQLAKQEVSKRPQIIVTDHSELFTSRFFVGLVTALRAKIVRINPFSGEKLAYAERFIYVSKNEYSHLNKEKK